MADTPGYQGRWSVVPWDKIAKHIQVPVTDYVVERVTEDVADLTEEVKPYRYGPLFHPNAPYRNYPQSRESRMKVKDLIVELLEYIHTDIEFDVVTTTSNEPVISFIDGVVVIGEPE